MFFAHFSKLYKSFGMSVCEKKTVLNCEFKKPYQIWTTKNFKETLIKLEIGLNFWTTKVLSFVEYQYCNTPGSLKTFQK